MPTHIHTVIDMRTGARQFPRNERGWYTNSHKEARKLYTQAQREHKRAFNARADRNPHLAIKIWEQMLRRSVAS